MGNIAVIKRNRLKRRQRLEREKTQKRQAIMRLNAKPRPQLNVESFLRGAEARLTRHVETAVANALSRRNQ
jgi:hypothetical protein